MFSSMEVEVVGLVVYFYICLFVDVDTVTKKLLFICSSGVKRVLFPLSGRKFRNHSIHISNPFDM